MNKISKSKRKSLFALFLIMFVLTLFKQSFRDDIYFADFANITGKARLLWFIEWRFDVWTSRVIIETILVLFARNFPWLWKILEPCIYVILAFAIHKVFVKKNKNNQSMFTIITCLILLIPQMIMGNSGWMATSLNYLWPTTFAIICLIPIKKVFNNEKIRWFEIPIYVACLLFAENVELVNIILFTVYFIFTVYFVCKRKMNPVIILMFLLSIANFAFILWCPGNAKRTQSEIIMNFTDYKMLNIVDKLFVGLYTTMQYYINHFNLIYVIFTTIIAINVYQKYRHIFYRIIAIFPVFMGIVFNTASIFTEKILPNLKTIFDLNFMEEHRILVNFENFDQITTYIPTFCCILCLGCLIASIYLIFRKSDNYIIPMLVLCAGICSKFIMGFIVTVFISEYRTQFIFMICMIILTVMMLDDKSENELKKYANILTIFAIFMVMDNFILCLTLNP